jgi:hypothetical protein
MPARFFSRSCLTTANKSFLVLIAPWGITTDDIGFVLCSTLGSTACSISGLLFRDPGCCPGLALGCAVGAEEKECGVDAGNENALSARVKSGVAAPAQANGTEIRVL